MPKYARWERPIQDSAGNLLSGLYCDVRREDVPLNPRETLYSDRDGLVGITNPFFTASGPVGFHAAGGAYQVRIYNASGTYDETFRYQAMGRGGESDISGLFPMGAYSAVVTYDLGDAVSVTVGSTVHLYGSRVDGNLNNTPDSTAPIADTTYWMYLGTAAQMVSTGMMVALSDEVTPLVARSPALDGIRNFGAFTITAVRASLSVASSLGSVEVDIKVGGLSILSIPLTIDVNELTSKTAAVPVVISNSSIPDDSEWEFDIVSPGAGAKGLKVTIAATVS